MPNYAEWHLAVFYVLFLFEGGSGGGVLEQHDYLFVNLQNVILNPGRNQNHDRGHATICLTI